MGGLESLDKAMFKALIFRPCFHHIHTTEIYSYTTLAAFPTRGLSCVYSSLAGRATCSGKENTNVSKGKPVDILEIYILLIFQKICESSYLVIASFHCLNRLHLHFGHAVGKTGDGHFIFISIQSLNQP